MTNFQKIGAAHQSFEFCNLSFNIYLELGVWNLVILLMWRAIARHDQQ